MWGADQPDKTECPGLAGPGIVDKEFTLKLHAEQLAVSKRVHRTLVRATRTTSVRHETVSPELSHEHIVVDRVAVGRVVASAPPIRQEGDVTIMPVIEEELVVVRRLILKEEIHLRRVRSVTTHSESAALREQSVSVTRTALAN